jgi:hypothetical protein
MAVEQVNQDILKILGLEETDEIDMKSYKGHLREKLVEISMGKGNLSRDEELIVQSEFQRIKKQPDTTRLKKKKITAQSIRFTKPSNALLKYKKISSLSKDIQSLKQTDTAENIAIGDKSISDNLKNINQTLDKILASIIAQGQIDRKRREKDRIEGEKRKAQERESGLEKPLQVAKNLVKKIVSPFQGILDRVFRFLGFTFLGWLIGKFESIQKWMEANQDKVKVVTRFLKDWGPTLLGAFVLFATPFGKFIRTTLKLIRFFIPKIIGLMRANPLLAALTLATVGGVAKIKESERIRPDVEKIETEAGKTLKSKEAPWYEKLGASLANQSLNAPTGPKNPTGLPTPGAMFARGGSIPLFGFSGGASIKDYFSGYIDKDTGVSVDGFGQDTQAFPIEGGGAGVLKPGEVVMNTGAVNAIGADKLLGWNRQFGGPNANKPINFTYKGGGVIGMQNGGFLGGMLPGTGTAMAPLSSGPADISGIQQTVAGYQNKLFGMNVGRPFFPRGSQGQYSPQENRRYYQRTGKYFVPTDFGPRYLPGIPGLYTPPKQQTKTTGLDPFRNFGKNVQTIQNATKRQEEMMRQMGHKPSGYVNIFGQSVRRQMGGLVPQGPFTPLPSPGYVRPQGSFIPKPVLALPGPMPGTTIPFGFNPLKGLKKGGVSVTTKTGIDIKGGMMGADTQFLPPLALQPGEELYVVPKQAVPGMDKVVAELDRNSNPAKIQSNLKGDVGPKVTFITLPNKVTSVPSKGGGMTPGKPQLPEFQVIMDSPKREEVASALGIIDLV